jgi:hypothetical protein
MAGPDNPAYVIGLCPNCHHRADTTEVTPIAITTGDTEKKCVVTPLVLPDMAKGDVIKWAAGVEHWHGALQTVTH